MVCNFTYVQQQQSTREIEDLEKLLPKIDSCLPELGTRELILTLTQLGINTEGKQDIVSNKRKLIRWIQKAYKDHMEDMDKEPEERKTTFEKKTNKICCFQWRSFGVTIPMEDIILTLGRSKKIIPGSAKKSNRHQNVIYDNGKLNNSYNRINMKLVRQTQVLLLLPQV